jgi:hypothetical protein
MLVKRGIDDTYLEITDRDTGLTCVNDLHAKTTDVVIDGTPRATGWRISQSIDDCGGNGFTRVLNVGLCFCTGGIGYVVGSRRERRCVMQDIQPGYAVYVSQKDDSVWVHAIRFSDMNVIVLESEAMFEIVSVAVVV